MNADEKERLWDALREAREDRDRVATGLDGETGWMRDRRVRRITELDAVIKGLETRIAERDQQPNRGRPI